jgi:hypothetical protein
MAAVGGTDLNKSALYILKPAFGPELLKFWLQSKMWSSSHKSDLNTGEGLLQFDNHLEHEQAQVAWLHRQLA